MNEANLYYLIGGIVIGLTWLLIVIVYVFTDLLQDKEYYYIYLIIFSIVFGIAGYWLTN